MAGLSPEIKIDYEELENFKVSVIAKGSILGMNFNEGKKDVKSTIVANKNAHSAIDREKYIRIKKQDKTYKESENIAIMRQSFIDADEAAKQGIQTTFQYVVPSNLANGTSGQLSPKYQYTAPSSSANGTSSNANGTP